ncbi:MAG: hypothetical protein AAFO29_03080 [Actinomycetota bacterium]
MSWLRTALSSLVGLVVDDGFLAIGALAVIAATAVVADERLLGTGDGLGWLLVILLAAVTTASVLRAVRAAPTSVDPGS